MTAPPPGEAYPGSDDVHGLLLGPVTARASAHRPLWRLSYGCLYG